MSIVPVGVSNLGNIILSNLIIEGLIINEVLISVSNTKAVVGVSAQSNAFRGKYNYWGTNLYETKIYSIRSFS